MVYHICWIKVEDFNGISYMLDIEGINGIMLIKVEDINGISYMLD